MHLLNIYFVARLVEEFMLLANMAVAHKTYKEFPKQALLRRHPPPKSKMMEDMVGFSENRFEENDQ